MKKFKIYKSLLFKILQHPVIIILLFLFVFLLLYTGFYFSRGTALEYFAINQLTVAPSTWFINIINGQEIAHQQQHLILSKKAELSILNGCEGFDVIFLMVAAIAAYPLTWKRKLTGAVFGILLMYGLNQIRIVVLFFALQNNTKIFDNLHGIISPIIMIVIGCVFFYIFTRHANKTITKTV